MDGEKARRVLFADNPLPTSCVIRNSNFSLWLDDEAREWKNEKRRGRRRRTRKREWMREAHYAFVLLPPKTPLIIGTFCLQLLRPLSLKPGFRRRKLWRASFGLPATSWNPLFSHWNFSSSLHRVFFILFDSKKKFKTKGECRRISNRLLR